MVADGPLEERAAQDLAGRQQPVDQLLAAARLILMSSIFLTFGAIAQASAIVTALFAIETKKRLSEELSP
jgi:hypothetical protein